MSRTPFDLRPVSGALGAEIRDVDLAQLDAAGFARVHQALHEHGVLFFRDQKLEPRDQVALARRFGTPDVHPIVEGMEGAPELVRVLKPAGESACFGTGWHSDNSFFERPTSLTLLYGVTIPPYGGDTLFASMEKAYLALSAPMRALLDPLRAVHSASRAYDPALTGWEKYRGEAPLHYRYSDAVNAEVEHPVVRVHPDTGRRSLYVNAMFTQRIIGLEPRESEVLLGFLYAHVSRPDLSCRFRWKPGSLAIWDNRSLQHYAMDDYQRFERVMHRVTVQGERPLALSDASPVEPRGPGRRPHP